MNYTGTSGNDSYTGDGSDEIIGGLGGDDVLDGGGGDDRLSGGEGNDTLYSYAGTDKLLDGGNGDDTIRLAGVTINGGVLAGGNGTDTLALDGAVTFAMARWNAREAGFESLYSYYGYTVSGTGDANRFDFSALVATSRYGIVLSALGGDDVIVGTDAYDALYGGDGDDTLSGNGAGDSLQGDGGNDTLNGGDGLDTLNGGTGDDVLNGGNDADTMSGESGNDTLNGGEGDDVLDGGADADTLVGGNGNDTLRSYSGVDVKLDGGAGDDTIALAGVTVNAGVLAGGTGADLLQIDGETTLAVGSFDAKALGFETFYNYYGYRFLGTSDRNVFDFSGVTAVSRYGAVLYGLAGNDVLTGGAVYDALYGGDDNDVLAGNGSGDYLAGEGGDDRLDGGDGLDTLYGGTGADTLLGGNDADSLLGESGNDTLNGGEGDDVLDGGEDADTLLGGNGADTLRSYGGADVKLDGGAGDDTIALAAVTLNAGVITGGTGIDTLQIDNDVVLAMTRFDAKAAGFENFYNYYGYRFSGTADANVFDFSGVTAVSRYGAVLYGLAGNDTLIGTAAYDALYGGDNDDTLTGNGGGDYLAGEGGSDTLNGGDGLDTLYGGDGGDTLNGGNDADSLLGEAGDDLLSGGSGDDVLDGGADADTVAGGDGNDTIRSYSGTDRKLDGGAGDDTVALAAVTLNAGVIAGGAGIDTLQIDNDVVLAMTAFDARAAGFENFYNYYGYRFSGTADANVFDFSGVTATSRYGAVLYGLAGNDLLTGGGAYDALYGGDDDDTLTGNGGGDYLAGEGGEDALLGGDGADSLYGGEGDDTLDGGSENDGLYGEAGNDTLTGGSGDDTLDGGADADSMSGGSGNDVISVSNGADTLADGGDDDDRIVLGTVSFGDGVLLGGKGIDMFDLAGQATFTGRRFAAADAGFENFYNYYGYRILGSSGANILDFSGLTAISRYGVILDGADGDDTLVGLGANDTLIGGAGDDTLEGGNGDDSLTGGDGGIDLASYAGASTKVTVTLAQQGAAQNTLGAGNDTLTGFEGVIGSRFVDTLTGDAAANRLYGGAGADRLDGGDGADLLQGDAGSDTLIGGAARDTAVYAARWVDYDVVATGVTFTVTDRREGSPEGTDTLQTIEQIRYANGTFAVTDTINAGPTANADAASVAEQGVSEPGTATASGSLLANDTDPNLLTTGLGETLTVISAAANGGATSAVAGTLVLDGVYGTLTLAADGSWTYQLDDERAATQALRAGESASEIFAYTIADAHGLTSTAALTVAIAGASDTAAMDDLLQVTIGQATSLDLRVLTRNDAFAPGTTVSGIINATGATVEIVDGRLVIVASGADAAFDYTLMAANGETSTAHVELDGLTYTRRALLTAVPEASAVDFVGGAYGDILTGGDGADRLVGNAGADKLSGGANADALYGGDGKDLLTGGAGADLLDGGLGPDTASYAGATAGVTIDLTLTGAQDTLGDGVDTLIAIENLTGSRFDDVLTGGDTGNLLRGGAGADQLNGGGGNDRLAGGAAADTLTGGRGADTFVYEVLGDFGFSATRPDRITDFSHAGGDVIDLSLIDPDPVTDGDQAFTFIGDAAFTPESTTFELRVAAARAGSYLVQLDINHDGAADYAIQVASSVPLIAEDFVL